MVREAIPFFQQMDSFFQMNILLELFKIRSLPNTNKRIWTQFLNSIPEFQYGVSVKHHTQTALLNKLILGIWGYLSSQLLKIIINIVRKNKFFTIFVPSLLRFKRESSDLLPSCDELLVSNLIGLKFFMIIEKA